MAWVVWKRAGLALAVGGLPLLGSVVAHALAEQLAQSAVAELHELSRSWPQTRAREQDVPGTAVVAVTPKKPVHEPEVAVPSRRQAPKQRTRVSQPHRLTRADTAAPQRGVFVRKATVLRLSKTAAIPGGSYSAARGERPAGLVLSGVGALGVGLRDGDILTHVAGAPARSQGQVISTVVAARQRRLKAVSGRFWRGGEPYNLVVEIPYPKRKR